MRARLLNLGGLTRAIGFALVGVAIVAAALHFRATPPRVEPHSVDAPASTDPLAEELKRCQLIADQAKDGSACEAAWAENRRRFFTYAPASAPSFVAPANSESR